MDNLIKGAVAGMLGSVVGSGVKALAENPLPTHPKGKDAPQVVLAQKLEGHDLPKREKSMVETSVHWTFGTPDGRCLRRAGRTRAQSRYRTRRPFRRGAVDCYPRDGAARARPGRAAEQITRALASGQVYHPPDLRAQRRARPAHGEVSALKLFEPGLSARRIDLVEDFPAMTFSVRSG